EQWSHDLDARLHLVFSNDGRLLVAGNDGVYVYDSATRRYRVRDAASIAAFAPDKRRLAIAKGKQMSFIDIASGDVLDAPPLNIAGVVDSGSVCSLAFAPDGRLAAGLSDGTVALCDGRTGRELLRFLAWPSSAAATRLTGIQLDFLTERRPVAALA